MFKHIECTNLGNLKSILVTGTLALSPRHHCHVLRVEEWMSHKLEPKGVSCQCQRQHWQIVGGRASDICAMIELS